MATSIFLSTVVMGGILLVITAVVLRVRDWRHQPETAAGGPSEILRAVNGPLGWSVAFFVVVFGVTGLAMLYASGAPVPGLDQATIGVLLLVVVAVVFVAGSLVAIYSAARSRGLNSAQAAGFGSVVLATLVLLAIVAQLFMGG